MWFCDNCQERNNELGSGECMVCGAAEPAAASSTRAGKKTKTGPALAAVAPVAARGAVWRQHETLLMYGEPPRAEAGRVAGKVAAFDLDSTLVVPKSGAKFARNAGDWMWLDKRVPEKLRELKVRGFHLLVCSNQAGIEKGQTTEKDVKGRVEQIAAALGPDVPVTAFLSSASDQYRKPSPAMWDRFVADYYADSKLLLGESFYCGDAAGRPKNWAPGKPRDFACSDRMFAANANLSFHTPEELFFGEKACANWHWGSPDPRDFLAKFENAATVEIAPRIGKSLAEKELVVLVGLPASGKSTVAKRVFEANGFFRANNDDSGSKAKSLKLAANALANGLSVVVDNTNPDEDTRSEWIELGKRFGVKHFRCYHFSTPRNVADHLNLFREMTAGRKRIPGVAFNSYNKRFKAPTVSEGFHFVETVPFALRFETDRHRALFLMWQ